MSWQGLVAVATLAMLAGFLPSDGHAGNANQYGSVSTGEVDTYHDPLYLDTFCALTPSFWTIAATLLSQAQDVLLVTVSDRVIDPPTPLLPPPSANAGVLSQVQPQVSLVVWAPWNCPPFTTVTGVLVSEGEAEYSLSWEIL